MDLSCGRGLGLEWGGPPDVGSCQWAGAPLSHSPPQGRVQQLLSTDPTQQTAGVPPAPDTPKGLGTPPLLGCCPQIPHSPWGEPGPSTVPPLPPQGSMRVHPSQAHCQLPPRETPALWHSGAGRGSTGTARSPLCWGGLWGLPTAPGTQRVSCSALQCQGHPGPLQAIHKCYQCGRSCTPDSQGAAPPKDPPASLELWRPQLGW